MMLYGIYIVTIRIYIYICINATVGKHENTIYYAQLWLSGYVGARRNLRVPFVSLPT